MSRRAVGIVVAVAMIGGACAANPESEGDRPTIVVTTTILGDVVETLVAGDAEVEVLMAVGVEPHEFQPSARQLALIAEADLVVVNGLGLEEGMLDVLAAAVADGANVLEVAPLVDPIVFTGGTALDPHFWMDPSRMAEAVRIIGERLAAIDTNVPAAEWASRTEDLAADLLALDTEIAEVLSFVPDDERKLVGNHDALGYFAARYGFRVVGAVIPGGSTLTDPSSAELAALVETMRTEGVDVIFAETTDASALAEAVAAELGDVTVVELFTGSLGEPGSGAETYRTMLLADARLIADALTLLIRP